MVVCGYTLRLWLLLILYVCRYQVAIDTQRKNPLIVERGSPLVARFTENLVPGRTYQVKVKTVSGSVASWPATGNVTTRPLPVQNLRQSVDTETGEVVFQWDPHPESVQDSYRVNMKYFLLIVTDQLTPCCADTDIDQHMWSPLGHQTLNTFLIVTVVNRNKFMTMKTLYLTPLYLKIQFLHRIPLS